MKLISSIQEDRIYISWLHESLEGGVVAYWVHSGEIVYPLIDYCIYLLDTELLRPSTVSDAIFNVKRFMEYLWSRARNFDCINDKDIEKFRDFELASVHEKANRSPSRNAHKRTVNAKLRRIYHFLSWLQDVDRTQIGLIGLDGSRVSSSFKIGGRRFVGRAGRSGYNRFDFPKTFPRVGEGSKHKTAYCATETDVGTLQAYFVASKSSQAASRNILMMDIACITGLRRGAVNSLRCEQFSRQRIDCESESIIVVPDSQKFGYEKPFSIPIYLALRILDYIEEDRAILLHSRGWPEQGTKDRLFVSFRDGKPLQDRTISQIFGDAFSEMDLGRRAAYHAFRHKFANDQINRELAARLELGLDTSVGSIATSVSIAMGHENPASLEAYVSRQMGKFRGNILQTSVDRIAELERENLELKNASRQLRRRLRQFDDQEG